MKKVDFSDWLAEYIEDNDISSGEKLLITLDNVVLCEAEVSIHDDNTIEFSVRRKRL